MTQVRFFYLWQQNPFYHQTIEASITNQLDQIYISCTSDITAMSNIEPDNSFHFEVYEKLCKSLVSLKHDRIPIKHINPILEYTYRVFAKS
jgi:hypothetical protein